MDTLDKKVDFYLRFDNTEEEIHIIEIKKHILVEEHGIEYDYQGLTMGELLDIYDSLWMAEKE